MTVQEKAEIGQLPEKYRPLGAWAYFGYNLLFAIPLIGFIFLLIFSFDNNHLVRRSYARSFFCMLLILGGCLLIPLLLAFGLTGILK